MPINNILCVSPREPYCAWSVSWAELSAAQRRGDVSHYRQLCSTLFDDPIAPLPYGDFDALTASTLTCDAREDEVAL
jgi:hypothetical protein